MAEGQVAVLIDVENVGLSPVQELFDQLANVGRIIVKRAYSDWSGARARDRDRLQALGIEPVQVFHSGAGKNSADIRLAIDAIELSFQSPVDTFVVVSDMMQHTSACNAYAGECDLSPPCAPIRGSRVDAVHLYYVDRAIPQQPNAWPNRPWSDCLGPSISAELLN